MQPSQAQHPESFAGGREKESNLSPKAKLVHDTMDAFVMREIETSGLREDANALYRENAKSDDPRVEAFFAKCDELRDRALENIRTSGGAGTQEDIVYNYFSKLKKSFELG